MSTNTYVEFNNIAKKYDNSNDYSVKDFNLQVKDGEFIVFVGPSGCGKSTTLRMIAGLEEITEGDISIEGRVVNDVHPKDRDIAFVFQNYALYPHMSVYDNMAFGLKIKKIPVAEIAKKIDWAADILGLKEYLQRKPKDLSGGQRQRVALGRAIVRNPKVFLMDEPLSNLDAKLRGAMRNEITKLHRDLDATTIYVTHDQVEAMTMADRIVVMKDGIIQQVGEPMELYERPNNLFVAGFIGAPQMNFLDVTVNGNIVTLEDGTKITLPEGLLKKVDFSKTDNVVMGIRPEHMSVDKIMLDSFPEQTLTEKIENLERMGHENHGFATVGHQHMILKLSSRMTETIDDSLTFALDVNKAHFFDKDTQQRI